jgi:hypothetical protein
MGFPSHLLDELARVFARAALDRLLQESMQESRERGASEKTGDESPPSKPKVLPSGGIG